jgi:hypothetical protein
MVMVAVMTTMVGRGVCRNYRTNQNDECNGS